MLPGCHRHAPLGSFNVSGIHSVIAKYNESGKISIHARVDQGGVFALDKAEAVIEHIEFLTEPPPPRANATANETAVGAADNSTDAGAAEGAGAGKEEAAAGDQVKGDVGDKADNSSGSKDGAGEGKGGAKPPSDVIADVLEKVARTRKRTLRLPLNVTGGLATPGMDKAAMAVSTAVLRGLRLKDQAKRDTARARNDLESYIISTRDKACGGGGGGATDCQHGARVVGKGGARSCHWTRERTFSAHVD